MQTHATVHSRRPLIGTLLVLSCLAAASGVAGCSNNRRHTGMTAEQNRAHKRALGIRVDWPELADPNWPTGKDG